MTIKGFRVIRASITDPGFADDKVDQVVIVNRGLFTYNSA